MLTQISKKIAQWRDKNSITAVTNYIDCILLKIKSRLYCGIIILCARKFILNFYNV